MSKDLAVAKLMDTIELTGVEVRDTIPPTIELRAPSFSNIEGVYVNGFKSPEFIQQSSRILIVQIPDDVVRGGRIHSLSVLSYDFTVNTPRSFVRWSLNKRAKYHEGALKLLQNFTFILLQTPGSDIFDQSRGGGLMSLVGKSGTGRKTSVTTDVISAINTTQTYLKQRQASSSIPNDEKLLHARLTQIAFTPEETAVNVSVELTSMAGRSVTANVSELLGEIS